MNRRLMPLIIFIAVAILAAPYLIRLGPGKEVPPVVLATLQFEQGRAIRFTVERNSQQTLSLHYDALIDQQPQVEHAFFGTLPLSAPPPAFVIYAAEQGDILAIAQATAPDQVILIHDFTTGDSFPHRRVSYKDTDPQHIYPYFEEQDAILERGDALFARLQAAMPPDSQLTLLRTMGTRPLTMPDPAVTGKVQTEQAATETP